VGRFISKDPIGFMGGDISLYRYVRNNPIRFKDPLGLQFEDPCDWPPEFRTVYDDMRNLWYYSIDKMIDISQVTAEYSFEILIEYFMHIYGGQGLRPPIIIRINTKPGPS